MKVLIVAGGTGGHLFPAIRLAEEIRLRQLGEILFVTSSRLQDKNILKSKDIAFKTLPVVGFQSKSPVGILDFTVRLTLGTIKSLYLVLRFRPKVVIGFGGYISGPLLLSALLLRIKTIIHEQNVYPGKTNRILAHFVNKIAINFSESFEYLKKFESKIILSGNPLRKELKRVQKEGDSFTFLVMGGSQGAHVLNKFIPEAVSLIEDGKKKLLEVVHISGGNEKEEVIKSYKDKGIRYRVFSFTEDIDKLYNESDFVIARSGATTVSELLYLGKPAILVPYPYANSHQLFNAKVLENKGGAILLEEKDLTPQKLCNMIVKFMNRDFLNNISRKLSSETQKDACDILMKEIAS